MFITMEVSDRDAVEALVIAEVNNNYYHQVSEKKPRCDGKWTIEQVYEMFKDDPIWHVSLHTECGRVGFRERKEKQTNEKNRNFTMMLFAHYVTKHSWKLNFTGANIVVYGGFARSAMLAWNACKTSIYETMLCCKRWGIPKDVAKLITMPILETWCDDFTWFRDKVRDLDLLVSYHNGYKPAEHMFGADVRIITKILNELCERESSVHSYTPDIDRCMTVSKTVDRNCHRRGETSHRYGDYFNYLVRFDAPEYVGEKVTRWSSGVDLDITTMIDNDQSDCDVNNLVFYFDFKRQIFRFGQRKQIRYPEGLLTLARIEQQVVKRQFRHVFLDYKHFDSYDKFYKLYNRLRIRASNLEYAGWKQDPRYKKIHSGHVDDSYLEQAHKYFNVDTWGYPLA